jgi:hypothetical protein
MKNNNSKLINKLKSIKPIYYISIVIILIGLIVGIVFLVNYLTNRHSKSKSQTNSNINLKKNGNPLLMFGSYLSDQLGDDPKPNTPTNVNGYFQWTWGGNGSGTPSGSWNIGILFGGEDPKSAIINNVSNSFQVKAPIKYLNLGGGLDTTGWSLDSITYVNNNLQNIKNNNWDGLCFDIEVCTPNVSFVSQFADCFSKCKSIGLDVLITTSGILPYACKSGAGQGNDLINAWLNDQNIDYISPQLYGADGQTLESADLTAFGNAKAKIIPTVPYAKDWDSIQDLGIKPYGYLVWNHDNITPPINNNICGTTWSDALNNCNSGNPKTCMTDDDCNGNCYKFPCYSDKKCGTSYNDAVSNCAQNSDCPNGVDSDCPAGQQCFGVPKVCA